MTAQRKTPMTVTVYKQIFLQLPSLLGIHNNTWLQRSIEHKNIASIIALLYQPWREYFVLETCIAQYCS